MSGGDSSGKGVLNNPTFWAACTVILAILVGGGSGIRYLAPVIDQVPAHEKRIADLEAKVQDLVRTDADRRLTSLEVSREQRWQIITGGMAAVREELSGLRATMEATKNAINRLQDAADRPLLGRANR